ncbi:AcrR family transcriptional regulator [Salirhabdus euzebyi]|uniref:AcrR family transcriptional regulator n=1 Tax=Salirhabdus euzebyi TaxID=394506 RepID=A0A841Q6Y5_9BACI|nr:TetR/AcrR family transcriptional regulator [Salirhabdus euzebyi]MBB6454062.1 AcrR family transcriptional regulator [Salirhabdus euzebyi]
MSRAFEKLAEEKQQVILKVCIEEFAKNGYEKTTTEMITKRAGISKGLIFHYFGSKKNLFLYIVKYVYELLADANEKEFLEGSSSTEFFERVKDLFIIKSKLSSQYFYENQFILNTFFHPPVALKEEINKLYTEHLKTYKSIDALQKVFKKELINEERLREGITPNRVLRMTMFIVEQLTNKFILTLTKQEKIEFHVKDLEPIITELEDYLEIVKLGVYK